MSSDFDNAFKNLLNAICNKNVDEINKYKYEALWDANDLLSVVFNYLFICQKLGVDFDFGKSKIEKGMAFYRIRRFEDGVDFSNENEWRPSPYKKMNRANSEGETALYLGSNEFVCVLETHLQENERYVLGKYECVESFDAGGFFSVDKKNNLHMFASMLLNACLIAPARESKNDMLFSYLESKLSGLRLDNLGNVEKNLLDGHEEFILPFKLGYVIQKNTYELTNALCNVLKKSFPKAIRYSSCYAPIEGGGFESNAFNLAVFENGLPHFRWVGFEQKTNAAKNGYPLTDVNVAKMFIESGEKHE